MSYKDMITKLKQKNNNITLVKNGAFYIAIGNDAILLNNILKLKCTCFSKRVCKVGFPIASLRKYANKLKEAHYNYSVYELLENVNDRRIELKQIESYIDGINNNETKTNLQCNTCKKCKFKQDKYEQALENYIKSN